MVRKRIIIEVESGILDERRIMDRISMAAMKVLKANKGSLIGITQQDITLEPYELLMIPDELR